MTFSSIVAYAPGDRLGYTIYRRIKIKNRNGKWTRRLRVAQMVHYTVKTEWGVL